MVVYDPFWKTLKERGISTYYLIQECNVSSSTIDRLRKNKPVTTVTINDLCRILHCRIQDIAQYLPDKR